MTTTVTTAALDCLITLTNYMIDNAAAEKK
jgi:hypothetical protein